ncbi:MAG: SiaB family protein kinase [Bacteroidales bacterium]|nr:SiaB family protein kinase [Bacteroidales bacterium]
MDITNTIHDKIRREHLLFVFRGEITEKNSLPLLTLLENEMKEDSYDLSGRKRLFMYVLESLQNIVKHGDQKGHAVMPLVSYSKTDDGYTITTGNVITEEQSGLLRDKLEKVNSLDAIDIKALYRQILETTGFSEKGGAGLGLLEMALKTGNRLDFDFIPIGGGLSYFVLSKTVDSSGLGRTNGSAREKFDGSPVLEFERLLARNNVHMTWSGHITSGIGDDVLSITEARLSDEDVDARIRRKVFNIMVEILENVSRYNPGKEAEEKYGLPLAMVRFESGRFVLTTGNLISGLMIGELKQKLDNINSFSQGELKTLFFASLSAQSIETDSTGNMGLISMARKSGGKLEYQFKKVNEEYSYFMLTVRVENTSGSPEALQI